MKAAIRKWYLRYKGFVGHSATGLLAGGLVGFALAKVVEAIGNPNNALLLLLAAALFILAGVYISTLVQIRQTVSWLHKHDDVGVDLQEHLQAAVLGLIVVFISVLWEG